MLLPALIRVLHVDDEESQREFAKMFLEQDGVIQVTSATSGKEALQLLEKESYDCVVSDYMLPGMDGVELARRIRETSTVPFILYADREIEEVAEAAFKVGIDDYVRKEVEPAHFQVLARRIRQAVERARGEKNLKVSEEKFRRFFMNQPVLCYMVSKEGNILDVNKTVLDTLGYTREELIGKPVITTLYSPSSRGKAEQLFKRWVKTGVVRNEELNIVTKTGEERTVLLNVDAVRDERGGVIQGISVQVDITQRRQMEEELRESEERFRTLVENSPNAISVTIGDTIIYANQKRAELAGKDDPSELVGTSSISQIAEGDRESIVERMEARKRGEKLPLSYEFRMLRADGSIRDIIGYSSAISYQGNNAVQHVLHDVTEQKRHEAMLEALHRHSADLSKAETVEEVAEETLDCVERVIGFNVGSFAVVEGDLLRHIHIKGVESAGVFEMPLDGRGVTVRAVRTGETQLVPDCREDDDYEPGLASGIFEALSELAVPVKVSGKVVAVINVESTKLDAFTEEDRRLLEILASHTASTITRLWLVADLREHGKRLAALQDNTLALHRAENVEEIVAQALDTMEETLRFKHAGFAIVDNDVIRYVGVRGVEVPLPIELPIDGRSVTARVVRTGRASLIPDVRLDEDFVRSAPEEDFYVLSELAVPVKVEGGVVVVLNAESDQPNAFDEQDQTVMEILAANVSVAFTRLRRVRELEEYEKRLEALHSHAKDIAGAETLEKVADMTFNAIDGVLGFNQGGFGVVEGNLLRFIYIRSVEMEEPFKLPLDGSGITVRAVRTGETQLVPDIREDKDYVLRPGGRELDSLSELAVSVKVEEEAVAVINVESERLDAFTDVDRKLMEILASHVASALRKIRDHEEIIRRQKLMEDLYENAPMMYMSLDSEGVIARVNRTTAEALGYLKEELTGRPMASLLSESSVKAFREEFPVLLESGELHGAERQLVRKDGSIIEAVLDASVEYDEGRPVSTRAVMRDITLRKMAERRVMEMAFNMEGLTPGSCYVCEDHERCMRTFAGMLLHGVPGLCLTREDPGRLVAEYGVDQRSILLVSSRPVAGFEAVADLQEVNRVVTRFLKEHETTMVLLDGLEYLVTRFSFEAVYAFLQEKRFDFLEAKAVLLIPLDLATLSETERALLASELKILE